MPPADTAANDYKPNSDRYSVVAVRFSQNWKAGDHNDLETMVCGTARLEGEENLNTWKES
jgi:hypothetical protein